MTAPSKKSGHGEKLSRKMETAIVALLTQGSIGEAARACKISESTLRRWLKEREFQAAYSDAKAELLRSATAQLRQLAGGAVNTLAQVSGDSEAAPGARVSAAVSIIRLALESHQTETLEIRIQKLEGSKS